jgi:hypothetical protein
MAKFYKNYIMFLSYDEGFSSMSLLILMLNKGIVRTVSYPYVMGSDAKHKNP